ncbi:dTDP-4-dehydrorhamnose 3,5-epimerase family protein [Candidatus Pelagibacter sp.]|nr:dTDP-4-dehydrorhamnose 3,5-epimerase family protein [Candidatus Pelagibacter sp.]|tara:strand:- start:459 stop:887 length:429 start_codon:yes stop_codon:yes gene_type:complete
MKIIGVKKIPAKLFENNKGDLLKFVSKKNSYFKSFGEIYFNEIKYKKKKGWIKHLKNQCILSVAFGEINIKLIDDRKKSKTFDNEENIILNTNKHSVLIVPPGIWFSFTTNKKKSVLVNLINSTHSDKETLKSKKIKNYYIK